MQLSKKSIEILRSFFTVNRGILFKPGKEVKTISVKGNILAKAVLDEEITQEFSVYDLNNFVDVLSISENASFSIDEKFIKLKNVRHDDFLGFDVETEALYRVTEVSNLVLPPKEDINFPEPEINVKFSKTLLGDMLSWSSRLDAPNIRVSSDGEFIYLGACDVKGEVVNKSVSKFANGNGDKFEFVFRVENLSMYPGHYSLSISSKGVSHWKCLEANVEYWITTEKDGFYQKA
jgi:hypothetical protein